jgi:hypothetical protein
VQAEIFRGDSPDTLMGYCESPGGTIKENRNYSPSTGDMAVFRPLGKQQGTGENTGPAEAKNIPQQKRGQAKPERRSTFRDKSNIELPSFFRPVKERFQSFEQLQRESREREKAIRYNKMMQPIWPPQPRYPYGLPPFP